jgi:hypothetical protein
MNKISFRSFLLLTILNVFPMGYCPAQTSAQALTLMISNEAPGNLIDNLIASGYRDSSLYAVLVALKPSSGGIISDAFLNKLATCPANSDVFTAKLYNFSDPSNNPVGIGEDGNLVVAPVYGKDLSGKEGYTTYNDTLVPVELKLFTKAIGPQYYIDAAVRTADGIKTYYKAFAVVWSLGSTIVLSNEAPGSLIDKLIAAGHGSKNLYQVLQFLSAQPGSSIPKDFVTRLGSAPNGSDVKSEPLTTFANIANNPVCINSDGSAHIASIYGKNYYKNAGYLTNSIHYPGIAPVNFTHATSKNFYINAGTGSGIQSYEAFGIVWATEAPTTFVLSNEGGLIDDLIRAGHGTKNLYQTLQILKPKSGGIISDEFMTTLAKCPPGSDIFMAALSNFGNSVYNPVCINTDGTLTINAIYGKDYLSKVGYSTLPLNQGGYTPELFTKANSTDKYIDAGSSGSSGGTAINYKAFAIAWKASTTFVLSNEGGLIDDLIRAGHGTKNLYQTLQILKPKSGGVISDEFMATLAKCPAGSDIFTAALSKYTGINNPVCVNTDGTLRINDIFGKDYLSMDGYTTLPLNQGGYTPELFIKANSTDKYIDAGSSGISGGTAINYKAFAVAWSQPATLTVGSAVVNIGGKNGSTATFAITSNTAWNITSDQLWLTAVPSSGTGNATVTLTAQANPNAVSRTAKITVTGTGATSREITVTQSFNTGISSAKVNVLGMVPNPTTGKIRFTVPGNMKIISVAITDIRGRQVFTALRLAGNEMDLSPLLPGIYLVRVVTGREVFNGKLVKE